MAFTSPLHLGKQEGAQNLQLLRPLKTLAKPLLFKRKFLSGNDFENLVFRTATIMPISTRYQNLCTSEFLWNEFGSGKFEVLIPFSELVRKEDFVKESSL